MSEFKIEKDVAIPGARGRIEKYPFRRMVIGDSVFMADITRANLAGSLQWAGIKLGAKFVTREVTENEVKGVRVWRIA